MGGTPFVYEARGVLLHGGGLLDWYEVPTFAHRAELLPIRWPKAMRKEVAIASPPDFEAVRRERLKTFLHRRAMT